MFVEKRGRIFPPLNCESNERGKMSCSPSEHIPHMPDLLPPTQQSCATPCNSSHSAALTQNTKHKGEYWDVIHKGVNPPNLCQVYWVQYIKWAVRCASKPS